MEESGRELVTLMITSAINWSSGARKVMDSPEAYEGELSREGICSEVAMLRRVKDLPSHPTAPLAVPWWGKPSGSSALAIKEMCVESCVESNCEFFTPTRGLKVQVVHGAFSPTPDRPHLPIL